MIKERKELKYFGGKLYNFITAIIIYGKYINK